MIRPLLVLSVAAALLCPSSASSGDVTLLQATQALRKSVEFFRREVSARGGYLWRYSADLTQWEGEGRATAWVQPPGSPTVGGVYLFAYKCTKNPYYREAAVETAQALVAGQLQSGGWDYRIEFDPADRRRYAYLVDRSAPPKPTRARNMTTLDDDTTQAALRFLMRVDEALGFQDVEIHGSVDYALDRLLKAQYPNGAWPQRFDRLPNPAAYPVLAASFPESWSRTHPRHDYRGYYTFNDNTIADMIDTMLLADQIYDQPRFARAARRAGDFILLAQLPQPQPAWAQQYNAQMHPAWARKFEPPAVTGGESQGVMQTLLTLHRATGDQKYLQAIPSALAYLRSSLLPDGRLARFYELKTNRPLYFTKGYELTYDDDDLPTHYGFQVSSRLDAIESEYQWLKKADPATLKPSRRGRAHTMTAEVAAQAQRAIDQMDSRGAWVETGRLSTYGNTQTRIISTRTFVNNVRNLATYIAASKNRDLQ